MWTNADGRDDDARSMGGYSARSAAEAEAARLNAANEDLAVRYIVSEGEVTYRGDNEPRKGLRRPLG